MRKEGVPEGRLEEASNLLIGQALSESGNLNPLESHDHGTGLGIYGAGRERKTRMLNWLAANGYPADSLPGQAAYMAHEAMTGGYPRTRNILMNADPANRATNTPIITREFEAPAVTNYRTGNVNPSGRSPGARWQRGAHCWRNESPCRASESTFAKQPMALDGGVDRSSVAKELEGNEALIRRYATMTYREVLPGASDRALTAQAETAANRALKRNYSLEQALWGTREHGEHGYYPPSSIEGNLTDAELQHFKTVILPRVLAGSDVVKGMTGNASDAPGNPVRSNQIRRGTPYTDEFRKEGGDTYFDEDVGKTLPRLPVRTPAKTAQGSSPL